jgi:hypothetical protein
MQALITAFETRGLPVTATSEGVRVTILDEPLGHTQSIHVGLAEDARTGAKHMYHNDRVLHVMLVVDSVGSFVEWIER